MHCIESFVIRNYYEVRVISYLSAQKDEIEIIISSYKLQLQATQDVLHSSLVI